MCDGKGGSIVNKVELSDGIGVNLGVSRVSHWIVIAIKPVPANQIVGIVDFLQMPPGNRELVISNLPEK